MKLKVILVRGEDFGYVAHVPALLGCHSQGDTLQQAMANVREAIELWLECQADMTDKTAAEMPNAVAECVEV